MAQELKIYTHKDLYDAYLQTDMKAIITEARRRELISQGGVKFLITDKPHIGGTDGDEYYHIQVKVLDAENNVLVWEQYSRYTKSGGSVIEAPYPPRKGKEDENLHLYPTVLPPQYTHMAPLEDIDPNTGKANPEFKRVFRKVNRFGSAININDYVEKASIKNNEEAINAFLHE